MIYEEKLSSATELAGELSTLDYDGGIRLAVMYEGSDGFAFVSRSANGGFALAIYGVKKEGREKALDGLLLFSSFNGSEELISFLNALLAEPLTAFKY